MSDMKINKYNIGITTYSYRFDDFLVPLIKNIKEFKPDSKIILAINGNYNVDFNEEYRIKILNLISNYSNIYPVMFMEFRSLSKLWNSILINSDTNLNLILNDDVTLTKEFFVNMDDNTTCGSFKINSSWSAVFLDRDMVNVVGWFDERFLGIGEEDGDFEYRFRQQFQTKFKNKSFAGFKNHIDKKNVLVGSQKVNSKYSKFNYEFCCKKYNIPIMENGGATYNKMGISLPLDNLYPVEKFYWENKNKL